MTGSGRDRGGGRRGVVWAVAVITVATAMAFVPGPVRGIAESDSSDGGRARQDWSGGDVKMLLRREGTIVRRDGDVTVERVRVPSSVRDPGDPRRVYRVRIDGRYPPRALRYELVADGRRISTAIPAGDLRSVVAITDDDVVLSAALSVAYGGRPALPRGRRSARFVAARRRAWPTPGPYDVARRVYDLGDRAFRPSGLRGKVELRADVHHPAGLPDGPYPIVLFLHGNHSSCFRGNRSDYRWPCRPGWKPIPNHAGYDYLASRLASYGYIVVSVSGNGVNVLGNRVPDTGMRQRGELIQAHLDLWQAWSTTGGEPFGDRFVGQVDLSRVGTMGHSRGGEGVIWHVIVDRERSTPFGVDAVLPLAPVDFTRETANEVPLAVMLPYCDGDVSDLQGVHMFDDARYRVPGDPSPKQTITAFGANHNFFNTVWTPSFGYPGSFDDSYGRCDGKLRAGQQRRVGAAYIVSFFRRYVGGETALDPVWTGAVPPPGLGTARALLAYLAPDLPTHRLDVDRFTDGNSIRRTERGDPVTTAGLSFVGWCENTFEAPCVPGELAFFDAHLPGLSRGVFGWSRSGGRVRFDLGAGVDVGSFDAVQMRAALNPGYPANGGIRRQDLTLVLVDGAGAEAAVAASDVGAEALVYPSGLRRFTGHVLLQQLRFPLQRFHGIDLSNVTRIAIRFDRTRSGTVDVADLAFTAGE